MLRIPVLQFFWTRRVLTALVMSAALLAAACGSGSTTTQTETGQGESAAEMSDADMEEMSDGHDGHHDHGSGLEVPDGMAIPGVDITITEDQESGQNLIVSLTDFDVTPELASLEAVNGGGHMHLYVNGEREGRFYNEAVHLDLPPGDHLVEVELSANNHQAWLVDGEPIRSAADVTVAEPGDGHNHSHGDDDAGVVDWTPVPDITSLTVTADPKSGWNVHAAVANFDLSAENASTDAVDGQGHMHLYVNGNKITRLYGEWHLLTDLAAGDNEVMVELNANDHTPLMVDGQPISATVIVTVSEADAAGEMAMADDTGHGEHGDHGDDESDKDGHHDEDTMMMDEGAMEEGAIVLGLANGEVISERDRYEVAKGDTVVLLVDSDVVEDVHVHGYDLHLLVGPDQTARLAFEASISGVFEIEFEESGKFLAELQVR